MFNKTSSEQRQRLRTAYSKGVPISPMITLDPNLSVSPPTTIMDALVDTFYLTLADFSCIDGWWPRSAQAELDDDDIDRLIRPAIEATRSRWSCEPTPL